MKEKVIYILLAFCVLAATVAYSAPPTPSNEGSKDKCLACHGPFDKRAAAPKTYAMPSGPKINPHMYVPHQRQDAKSIPECLNCHKVHPVPLKSKEGLPQADVAWCFSCHHTQEFSACKTCHTEH
jgi:predicted CXXCH cytochrome family protein